MKKWFVIFAFLFTILTSQLVFGQYNETIRSGRPGQSIGPFTVGKSILQIQTGFDLFGYTIDPLNQEGNGFLSNTVVRYGVGERFEISTLVDFKSEQLKLNGTEVKLSGLDGLDIGGRYHLYSGKGLIPNIGLQIRFRLPVLSEDYKIDHVAPRFALATSQKLSETFTLVTNWGGSWNGNNSDATGFYTINLSFPLAGQLSGFIENYGSRTKGNFNTYFDTGLAYLITNDLQLDILAGPGNNDGVKDYFISCGISWRTHRN